MKRAHLIAGAELRLLARSRVALIGVLALLLLSGISVATSHAHMSGEQAGRVANQAATDKLFEAQPARHPHRMVHYGSYVYRPVSALAGFDPGIDPFSGTTLYLEGHRQNSATISAVRENSSLMRFGQLTPAFVLQTLAPLLLIFLGFGIVNREHARGSLRVLLASGVTTGEIITGKAMALGVVASVALIPAFLAILLMAMRQPDEALSAVLIGLGYALYLGIWTIGITAVSAMFRSGQAALLSLIAVWSFVAIIAPRGGAELASAVAPLDSRAATDLLIQQELRNLGDSHNPEDPFFAAFKARTLTQYNVSKVEDLPFNFRGALSAEGEALTSKLFDSHLVSQAKVQKRQAGLVNLFSVFSPAIAVRAASMAGAGTDLETHLRFLAQGEAHRFAMVQNLNKMHANELTFADDAARSKDPAAERRTRIASQNWAKIADFQFEPTHAHERIATSLVPLTILLGWLVGMFALARLGAARLRANAL